jgi:phenylalanyl-tRNA synthetase beta chain
MIKEIAGGEISSDIVDVYPKPIDDFQIDLSLRYVNQLIGKDIPIDTVKKILRALDIKIVGEGNDSLQLAVPPYRVDVTRPADVVEEILRIYGYNNIEITDRISSSISHTERPDKHKVISLIASSLSANGFSEIMCNSLTKRVYYQDLSTYPDDSVAEIINPLSSDLNAMRQTLLFGGLESIQYNINHRNPNLKLYEWGNCYSFDKKKRNNNHPLNAYSEEFRLGIWLTGDDSDESWVKKSEKTGFFHVKSFVVSIFEKLGINNDIIFTDDSPNDIFEYGLKISTRNGMLGYLGLVSVKICQKIDIKAQVYFAELQWDKVFEMARTKRVRYVEIPKYPEVRRDLALLIDTSIKFSQIEEIARAIDHKLIRKINLFDVYQGSNLGEGKKSYAVSFTLQDESKTLTDKQIDKIMQNLIVAFEKELGAQIR